MPGVSIDQKEFETWLPFTTAYHLVREYLPAQAKGELRARLSAGRMKAACRESTWDGLGDEAEDRTFEILPHWVWRTPPTDADNVWATSRKVFAIRQGNEDPIIIEALGLRLEPSAVIQILADAGIDPAHSPKHPTRISHTHAAPLPLLADATPAADHEVIAENKSRISSALLDQFGELLTKAYPNATGAFARARFEGMFPDKSVTVRELRRVSPKQVVGRPLKDRDK